MNSNNEFSRVERNRKRRKTKRNLIVFVSMGFIFIALLITFITIGNMKSNLVSNDEQPEMVLPDESDDNTEDIQLPIQDTEDDDRENRVDFPENHVQVEYVEPSDNNVSEAFIGEWQPIGTSQTGEHATNYDSGSADRHEIKRAVSQVTGLNEETLIEWRVENGGNQNVIATVSDQDENDIYRVYLNWINDEGWQVKKVEKLIENDKKR